VTARESDEHASRLAAESLADGDVTGWFERLYSAAARGEAVVPWDRGGPHPLLGQWAQTQPSATGRAVVVGTGLGGDAELVAGLGFDTVAFDVSATAIASARQRFPRSAAQYCVADLLALPADWCGAFDLVVESLTVQSIPRSVRHIATGNVASLVAPGGALVVIATALGDGDPALGPPWPLTRAEIDAFGVAGAQPVRIDLTAHPAPTAGSWWLAEFHRPPG